MPDQNDIESKKILSEGENLKLLTEHSGWGLARSLLSEKILELQMIGDVVDLAPDAMALQVKAKKIAAETLFNWLQQIEGTVKQHIDNAVPPKKKPGYIVNEE